MSQMQRDDPNRGLLMFDELPLIRFIFKGKFLSGKSIYGGTYLANSFHKSSWGNMSRGHGGIAYAGMYITLHDNAILPDMFSLQYYRLTRSEITVVAFKKRIERLKPPPYATRCMQYRTDRPELRPDELDIDALQGSPNLSTSLALYRSRGECILYCMHRMLYSTRRCLNLFTIITLEMVQQEQYYRFTRWLKKMTKRKINETRNKDGNFGNDDLGLNYDDADFWVKFCERSHSSHQTFLDTRKHCLGECPDACQIDTYSEESVYNLELEGQSNSSIVEVVWAGKPITYVKHKAAMDLVDMLGSVGGNAHVYIGISIPYLINYIINLVQWGEFFPAHTCCCVATWWRSCFVKQMKRRKLNLGNQQ